MTWLVHAQKAGARFVKRCEVDEILLNGKNGVGVSTLVDKATKLTVTEKQVGCFPR